MERMNLQTDLLANFNGNHMVDGSRLRNEKNQSSNYF